VNKLSINADASQLGLCLNCQYGRRIEAKETTVYFLCERSLTDPIFPKYPRLPVLRCSGYDQISKALNTMKPSAFPLCL
jgi:hypothetical protein